MTKYKPLEGMTYYDSRNHEVIVVTVVHGDIVHHTTSRTTDNRTYMLLSTFENYCYTFRELSEICREHRLMRHRVLA